MLTRRKPIERRSPLPRRRKHIRRRRVDPRRVPPDYVDPNYLAWLRTRPCRCCHVHPPSDPHHLRHNQHGAALGAHIKDDRRAISLCRRCHDMLHRAPWSLRLYVVHRDLRAWQDEQLAQQRADYESWRC
jgi:hypothetical protein